MYNFCTKSVKALFFTYFYTSPICVFWAKLAYMRFLVKICLFYSVNGQNSMYMRFFVKIRQFLYLKCSYDIIPKPHQKCGYIFLGGVANVFNFNRKEV